MTSGLITWPEVAEVDGPVLLIVNSPADDERAVAEVFDALEGRVSPARLHVIATPGWHRWLSDRGWSDARVLLSADARGEELELNHFLESSEALRWIGSRAFTLLLGSAAHNLYNEEVKEVFERRVGVFLGDAVFLAHTLPEPYVFALGLDDLLQRFNRARKADTYLAVSRALVDDLHRLWTERGCPSIDDARSLSDLAGALERHLGADLLSWDERSAIPLTRLDPTKPATEFARYVESVLHRVADEGGARADDLRATSGRLVNLQREIDDRDRLLGELNAQANELQRSIARQQEEINRRDRRLVDLNTRANELQRSIAQQQEEINRRDRRLVDLNTRANELQRSIAQQQEEINLRDARLAEAQKERACDVELRDRRLAELHETLAREVHIRDQNLIDMNAERKEAVELRDAIIAELREELGKRR